MMGSVPLSFVLPRTSHRAVFQEEVTIQTHTLELDGHSYQEEFVEKRQLGTIDTHLRRDLEENKGAGELTCTQNRHNELSQSSLTR